MNNRHLQNQNNQPLPQRPWIQKFPKYCGRTGGATGLILGTLGGGAMGAVITCVEAFGGIYNNSTTNIAGSAVICAAPGAIIGYGSGFFIGKLAQKLNIPQVISTYASKAFKLMKKL
jgi:hypothetical protein